MHKIGVGGFRISIGLCRLIAWRCFQFAFQSHPGLRVVDRDEWQFGRNGVGQKVLHSGVIDVNE